MTDHAPAELLSTFLGSLYGTFRAMGPEDDTEPVRQTLAIASTCLRFSRLHQAGDVPLQVAVVGPTQVGKSTVVNLLLGAEQAQASPLAAFTDRLYGFARNTTVHVQQQIVDVLDDFRVDLSAVTKGTGAPSIVWDTPDFDSHRSHDYRDLTAKVCALADVFVVVVSKEKYSDKSVWKVMQALKLLDRKLVVCLNKVSSDHEVLVDAVRMRLVESGWPVETPVFTLPYIAEGGVFSGLRDSEQIHGLGAGVLDPANRCDHNCRVEGTRAVIDANWESWLQPVRRQLDAAVQWQHQVTRQGQEALATYEARYLDHNDHYNAFDQVILRLLELLEVPGIAGPLSRMRQVVTWPVRTIVNSLRNPAREDDSGSETTILADVVDHSLLSLTRFASGSDVAGRIDPWRQALYRAFASEADDIRQRMPSAIDRYQTDFEPEMDQAAHSIYTRLQESPVVLNTLRATRLGADVAGVVVAINTGTVGISEALLTPAMISLTSLLTEGAVGAYVGSVRNDLRDRQRDLVRDLLQREVEAPLTNIPASLSGPELFRIGQYELEQVEAAKLEMFR